MGEGEGECSDAPFCTPLSAWGLAPSITVVNIGLLALGPETFYPPILPVLAGPALGAGGHPCALRLSV